MNYKTQFKTHLKTIMSEEIYYQVACGDSYNGVYKRQIFTNLEQCEKFQDEWLHPRCSQSHCTITKHVGSEQKTISFKSGESKPENVWD